MSVSNRTLLIFSTIFLIVIAILHILDNYQIVNLSYTILLCARLMAYAVLVYYGFQKQTLTTWILIAMILGAEFGHSLPYIAAELNVISKIFLKLIKTIIAPLLVATLSVGIASQTDRKQLGRLAWKAIVYFEVITTFALIIGLVAINITKAGEGISLPSTANTQNIEEISQKWDDIILHIFPENIAKSIAEGQILQIVVFSILFGIALSMIEEQYKRPLLNALQGIAEAMFKYTNIIMYLAPLAVFGAIAYTVSHVGIGVLTNLLSLILTLYLALIALILLVFLPVALLIGLPLKKFILSIAEPVSIAFATTTSEAALPKAMKAMETLGVPRKIVSFIMPMGYSFNLDGSTLYLSLASVFVAQAAGIDMSWQQQMIMVFTLMLTSKGIAGVPRASLVILVATASSFGLPIEPIFIILGIDELMDMGRSGINVMGNCLATYAIAKWDGEIKD